MTQQSTIALITSETPEVVEVRSTMNQMEAQALALAIVDDNSSAMATDMLKQLRTARKAVEEKQDGVTKPLNDALKAARAIFKPLVDKYEAIEKDLKNRQLAYLSERARKAEEEAQRIRKEAEEAAIKEAEEAKARAEEQKRMIEEQAARQAEELRLHGNAEAADAVVENAARAADIIDQGQDKVLDQVVNVAAATGKTAPQLIRTVSGATAGLKKVWDFEVLDIKSLPAEYLQVNTAAVRDFLRSQVLVRNKPELAGVRFFQKEQLAVR